MTTKLKVIADLPPVNWDDFIKSHPNRSIALDGYVIGPSKFFQNENTIMANFNHHEGVDRLSTRATCAQVLLAVRQDLVDVFKDKNNEVDFTVFVNDCDQDVCLSWFILNNYWICQQTINPLINRLVHIEDMMDTCSGAYPFSIDMPIMKQVAWIFEPYTQYRISGQIESKDNKGFKNVIYDVERRIHEHILGKGKSVSLDVAYEKIGGGTNWSMVIEKGFDARTAMMSHGIKAFVSVRNRPDGKYAYSIGKLSNFFQFDLELLYNALNQAEQGIDKWGGSNTIGGSPRSTGSNLTPDQVQIIINDCMK